MTAPPLRIVHVVEAFSTGVFEAVRQIANAADAAGHEVHVAHARRPWTPPNFEEQFGSGIRFHRLKWDVKRRPSVLVAGALELRRLLRAERFDVIHLHSTFAGVAGALVRPPGVPTVYTPHGYMFLMSSLPRPARKFARMLERGVARRVSLIGAVSEAEAAEARRLGARDVRVIHNGIEELDELDGNGTRLPSADRSGVIACGRMSSQRQPSAVASIFERLDRQTRTAWVGDIEDEVAAARFRTRGTELTGWVEREEVLRRMAVARVYLHWTAWDGHPLSVLEAISVGTVVVGSDIAPVREILGENAVRATTDEGAELVEQLMVDDALYAELQRAQARIGETFSGREMTRQWLELYQQLARP
jgi:glycosyltransferase involved in cell wall biosynthesis